MNQCTKAHAAAIVSAGVAVFSAIHPGWQQPAWVDQVVPALGVITSAAISLTHHHRQHGTAK